MNFKKTALLLAMAGITAAPMAAQAEVYASARIGLINTDTGGVSEMQVKGMASRMGIKGENDLGNGMTSFGRYEFGVGTEGASQNVTRRHAFVGLRGDFGSVTLGQTYHTFYNFAYGPTDQPWWGAGYAVVLSPGRTSQGLTYAGGSGAVKFGATVYMDDTAKDSSGEAESIDGTELAVSFDAAGIATFALGISDKEGDETSPDPDVADPEPVTMITASGIEAGPVNLTIGYQMTELENSDPTAVILHAGMGNGYLHYESLDSDSATAGDPTSLTLGYTHGIGRNTTAWFEYQTVDKDTSNSDDDLDVVRAVLKVDF